MSSSTPALNPEEFRTITGRNTALPLALATALSAIFIWLVLGLVETTKEVDHSNQIIAKSYEALQLSVDGETGLRGFVITKSDHFLEPYHWSVQRTPPLLHEIREMVKDNPHQTVSIAEIQKAQQKWMDYAADMLSHNRSRQDLRDIVASEKGKRIMDELRKDFADFNRAEEKLRDDRIQKSQESTRNSLILILIGSLIAGALIAWHSRKQLHFVSTTYGSALESQAALNASLQEQDWLKTGQAQLADRARSEQDLRGVCGSILDFLCTYLDAKVGSLYLVGEAGQLSLSAGFGLSEEDMKKRMNLHPRSTLAGQVASSKSIMVLDMIPENHLKISTTLGSFAPTSIFLAPAVANGRTRGVIEFGFTRKILPRDLDLLKLLSENIGTAITSAQYRSRLQELLEESQRQSEELQSQQEELRVNNEELEEQTKALKESQARLETQQLEMEQTNSQLSIQSEALEKQNDELNHAHTRLEEKAKELERTSQYKSQFLANMSHELRTPLNSTLILSQLLIDNQGGRLSEEQVEFARTILSSSNDLLDLINEILDLAKVESGTVQLHPEVIDVNELFTSLNRTFKPVAERKSLSFKTVVAKNADAKINVDRQRLEQILKNLLSNALKFTHKGEVKIEMAKTSDSEVTFQVSDTGIGIPEHQQQVIFEAFQQADGTTSRHFGGTGLGLTISRDFARLLGGTITVESKPGKGSVFSLKIPSDPKHAKSPVEVPASVDITHKFRIPSMMTTKKTRALSAGFIDDRDRLEKSLRVLMIVEDDEVFAKVLYDLSHELKFQTILARTAEEAVDLANEFLPHAIILDMHLPDHSGLFVLDHLKQNPATRHIPVHIISANDQGEAALQMGAIGYLVKPTERSKLVEVMQKLEAKFSQNFKKVLVVEDNAVQRDSIKRLIAEPGVEVITADTGAGALKILVEQTIDCLILDLKLPDMTGFEVLEKMSDQENVSNPPVIVYTARTLTRNEEENLQKYSRTIILKGAKSPERLLSEVSLFLHQVESKMSPERQKVLRELRDRERTLEGRTILLVDDDVRNIFALNNALHPKGAKVEIARNGKEALAKLESNPEVDLILMDIMMPEMDGYEAMRRIRSNPKHRKLPIIAVTAKAMMDDQEKCIEAGASDYLAKPIDLAKLTSLIKVWLKPVERQDT